MRSEWTLAEEIALREYSPTPYEAGLLAKEVLRLRDLAEVKYELLRAEKGLDVLATLTPRIDKLYMQLNAASRGDETDLDGDPVQPWNNMVGALATALAEWLATARWAALEHRAADEMRASLAMVSEGAPVGRERLND